MRVRLGWQNVQFEQVEDGGVKISFAIPESGGCETWIKWGGFYSVFYFGGYLVTYVPYPGESICDRRHA